MLASREKQPRPWVKLARLIIAVDEVEEVGVIDILFIGFAIDDEGGGGEAPIEVIELGDESVGEDEIVVDECALRVAGADGDTPAQGLAGTGQDLGLAGSVLGFDF